MNRRHAKKVAKWWAGAILEAMLAEGFDLTITLRDTYTAEERKVIDQELGLLAQWLIDNGEMS